MWVVFFCRVGHASNVAVDVVGHPVVHLVPVAAAQCRLADVVRSEVGFGEIEFRLAVEKSVASEIEKHFGQVKTGDFNELSQKSCYLTMELWRDFGCPRFQ